MAVVTSVTIGSKQIDLEAFTGSVVDSQMTSYTREHTQNRPDGGTSRQYSTSYWNKFRVRSAEGKEWSLEVLRTVASVTKGDQVTLFWGVVDTKESDWLAVYNHSTDHLGFVPQTTAALAGPFLHQALLFGCGVIQFFALFGMVQWSLSAWITFLVLCAPWAWVFSRRASLKKAVRDAIRPGQVQPLTPNAPPPRAQAQDNEIRI
jgi:hypothetical protein